jgi:hypothetical protein
VYIPARERKKEREKRRKKKRTNGRGRNAMYPGKKRTAQFPSDETFSWLTEINLPHCIPFDHSFERRGVGFILSNLHEAD